ncbi:MAG: hypothetical protein ACYC55_00320 [Candidatus Geothermincolia bacterium]
MFMQGQLVQVPALAIITGTAGDWASTATGAFIQEDATTRFLPAVTVIPASSGYIYAEGFFMAKHSANNAYVTASIHSNGDYTPGGCGDGQTFGTAGATNYWGLRPTVFFPVVGGTTYALILKVRNSTAGTLTIYRGDATDPFRCFLRIMLVANP